MKSALVVDCDVNSATLPDHLRPAMAWKFVGKTLTPYLPVGTVFDGPQALFLCQTGQAAAADEECAQALGLTPEQARVEQRRYLSALAGIKGKNDFDLFMAEVIDGYDTSNPKHSDQTPVYKKGKFYAAYAKALSGEKQKESDE